MSDMYLPWGGDVSFASNGDYRLTTLKELAEQRVSRRIMSNPAKRNAAGSIVRRGDDITNPDYGVGAGEAVDSVFSGNDRAYYEAKARAAVLAEPSSVDVSVAPTITFEEFPTQGLRIMTVEFQTLTGEPASVNVSL